MSENAEAARQRIEIDVVSDVVCPWCFIGKKRLEQARALAPDLDVVVRWRPYQLDPTIPPGGIPRKEYLERKFGPDRAAQMHARLEAAGADAGVDFAFDRIERSPNTLDAHRVIRWAAEAGAQDAVKSRLLTLYFMEGADVGDAATLAGAAADCGMDEAAVRARLATDEDVDAVKADIETAQRMGVNGVPFFIIDGRYGLSGAQPAETIVAAMREALRG
ncbi:MAG TPA: DsbA family oxidoreductase [Beijerinckiaceae bacterium]|jgi:predicted DsbA family dithiol-disulfide isomerase